ncbi:hypothetical protein DAI22_08g099600 [Oryza sativa Japonica Group]|nr:hypothetical protein DAI22_08g099600 [Oryza sativa Japonica Group]
MEDMLSFFSSGLHVMLVDDDTKNTRTATKTLSMLHCPVVSTHTTACAGLRTLSGDNMLDVQTVLCDVSKVVSSGFDFRRVNETEHQIPVIYLLSTTEPEQMVAGEDAEVVAWHRCCLEERVPGDSMDDIAAHAGAGGEDGNDDDVVVIEEPQVHFKLVRSRGSRKRQLTINVDSGSSDSADANQRKKIEHMNDAKGPVGQHVASHLQLPAQEYCTKQQKDLDERRLISSDSLFLKAIFPTLNVSPSSPLILAGGAVPTAFIPRVGMTVNIGKAPMIELPFGVPVDDFLVGETAYGGAGPSIGAPSNDAAVAYAYTGALNNNTAVGSLMAPPIDEPTFTLTDPIVGTKGEGVVHIVITSEDQNALAAVEAGAPNNAEPFMMPDQVDLEEDIMFSLESLLGLDEDMIPMEDAGGEAAEGSLNIGEGGMEIGWDLDLDDILMNNTNEFAFLDDLAWIE